MLNLRIVDVVLANGHVMQGRAEGNNAAWLCPCGGQALPLLATTRPGAGNAQCPSCSRVFQALPEGGRPGARVVQVQEI